MTEILITKTGEEPGTKSLKVEIPVPRVEAAEHKAASVYAKRAKLPGFRPGKAPLAVIRQRFRQAIRESAIRELIEVGWKAAIDQEALKPIAEPRIKDLKFDEGAPVTFELQVEVKPELALERLGGFKLQRRTPAISDVVVAEQLDELRRKKAPWVPVESGTPKTGEMISVTIIPFKEDEEQEGKQYQIVLGQGQALPGIEDRIMGMTIGETVDATVRFPDDFPEEAKRGTTQVVRIVLHEIKRQDLPALDDALAREVGDFDSLDSLRAAVRSDMEAEAKREADVELRRQLIEEIVGANQLEAPRAMVQRVLSAYASAYKIPDDQLERFAAEFGPIAERQVKRDLVIDHVAEAHDLKATEDNVDARVEEIAKQRNAQRGQVYASLQKADRLRELERSLTEERVFAFLLEQSNVTDEIG